MIEFHHKLLLLAACVTVLVAAAGSEFSLTPEMREWVETAPENIPIELNDENFYETVFGNSTSEEVDERPMMPWMIMFYAPWCGHCKAQRPIFENASYLSASNSLYSIWARTDKLPQGRSEYQRLGARFALIDATNNPQLKSAFRVSSFPTFAFALPHQRHIFSYRGGRSERELEYFARYLYSGITIGMAPVLHTYSNLKSVATVRPPRVLVLVNEEFMNPALALCGPIKGKAKKGGKARLAQCEAMGRVPKGTKFMPPALADLLSVGTLHFAQLSKSEFLNASVPAGSESIRHIRRVFAQPKSFAGPNGERLALVHHFSSASEDPGSVPPPFQAMPFQGPWEWDLDPKFQRSKKEKKKEDEADDDDEDEIVDPSTKQGIDRIKALRPKIWPAALKWLERHAFLDVEDLSTFTFQGIAKHHRYIGILVAASDPGSTPTLRENLQHFVDERRKRLLLKPEDDSDDPEVWHELARRDAAIALGQQVISLDSLRFGLLDATIHTEFLADIAPELTDRNHHPTFIVFDAVEQKAYFDLDHFGRRVLVGDRRESHAALNAFIRNVANGEIEPVAVSTTGKIMLFVTKWVPLVKWLQRDVVGVDDTQFVVVVGLTVFGVIVIALALRPYPEDAQAVQQQRLLEERRRAALLRQQQQQLQQQQGKPLQQKD